MFSISFPDGKNVDFEFPIKCLDLLNYFEEGDGRIVALKVNNEIFSLNRVIDVDAKVKAVFLLSVLVL